MGSAVAKLEPRGDNSDSDGGGGRGGGWFNREPRKQPQVNQVQTSKTYKCKNSGDRDGIRRKENSNNGLIMKYVDSFNLLTKSQKSGRLSFSPIQGYFDNGQVHNDKFEMEIVQVAHVKLKNEPKLSGKCTWLWHGTRLDLLESILAGGLQPPPHGTNGLAGDRIYFADMASKSAQYCYKGKRIPPEGYLLLCRVYLGNQYTLTEAKNDLKSAPHGYNSVVCLGQYIADRKQNVKIDRDVLPTGRTVTNNEKLCQIGKGKILLYNEYIVYDSAQVQIQYLVRFKFS